MGERDRRGIGSATRCLPAIGARRQAAASPISRGNHDRTGRVARGPMNRGGDVVEEARGLLFAALLAALAGMVDAIGYLHLSGLFVSFMSGNSTQLAVALGDGNLAEVGTIGKLIALFVLGAAAGRCSPALREDAISSGC